MARPHQNECCQDWNHCCLAGNDWADSSHGSRTTSRQAPRLRNPLAASTTEVVCIDDLPTRAARQARLSSPISVLRLTQRHHGVSRLESSVLVSYTWQLQCCTIFLAEAGIMRLLLSQAFILAAKLTAKLPSLAG